MTTVRIPLHSRKYPGKFALVDEEGAERVSAYRWYPVKSKAGVFYAESYGRDALKAGEPRLRMHRLVLDLPQGRFADHINGDGLDNRRANLRPCAGVENARNSRPRINTSSRYKGVSFERATGRWHAAITANRKHRTLGRFDNEEDAARAYDVAAVALFGEFARLNFPEGAPTIGAGSWLKTEGNQAEALGKVVRAAWVEFCRIHPRDGLRINASHVAPWESLGEWDREVDRRIGLAVMAFVCPPGYVIVPKAEHDALLGVVGLCRIILAKNKEAREEYFMLADADDAYRAALKEES